jgi:hypothetical protein
MGSKIELLAWHSPIGRKSALVKNGGHIWMRVLIMDGPLSVRRVRIDEMKNMSPMEKNGRPYPLARAVRIFRHYGRAHGSTLTARRFMREATS